MKIQRTSVVELQGEKAQVNLQISDHPDPDKASQYVACSVEISTHMDPDFGGRPISLVLIQTRALDAIRALIQQADAARKATRP